MLQNMFVSVPMVWSSDSVKKGLNLAWFKKTTSMTVWYIRVMANNACDEQELSNVFGGLSLFFFTLIYHEIIDSALRNY